MRKYLAKFLLPGLLLASTGCVEEDQPANIGIEGGDRLPSFSITMENGEIVTDRTLHGKVGVIEFFNTGCSDCRRMFPVMQELYDEFRDNGDVEIVAIAREENKESIAAYWEEHDLTIPYSPQPDRTVYNLFATVGIPRIYISDTSGTVRYVLTDTDEPDIAVLRSYVVSLLP